MACKVNTYIYCGVILYVLLAACNGEALIEYIEESCYGSDGYIDALEPRCSNGEVIYPHDVYTYSKLKNTSCPWISYTGVRDEARCCRYVSEVEDCGMRYYGLNVGLEHYKPFTGQNTGLLQVAWNNTLGICDQTYYFEKTHYMRMTYNCINVTQTGSVCSSHFTGNSLYLWNDGYPNSDGGCSSTSGCECSIQSNGVSNIQIDALDIRFARNSTTGLCSQRLYLTDGLSESDIACDDVNLFERRTLFTTSSSVMSLRYDNTFDGSGGNFWIMVKATDSSDSLTISCGQSSGGIVEYKCGDNFTIISPRTTLPTETTGTSEVTTSGDKFSPTSTNSFDSTSVVSSSTSSSADSRVTSLSSGSISDMSTPSDPSGVSTTSNSQSLQNKLSEDAEESKSSDGKSKGPIVGAIIGAVAAAGAAGMIGYTIWRRKFRKNQIEPEYNDLFNDDDVITSRPPERAGTQFGNFDGLQA